MSGMPVETYAVKTSPHGIVIAWRASPSARSNVRVFHAFDLLCPDARCTPFRDGKPLVRDSHHLSAWGSGRLAPAFIALLEATRG